MQTRGLIQKYAGIFEIGMRLLDLASIAFASFVSYSLISIHGKEEHYLVATLGALLLAMILFPGFQLYEAWRGQSIIAEIRALVGVWWVVLLILVVLALMTKTTSEYSRLWMGLWLLIGSLFLIISRLILRYAQRWMRSMGFNQRRLVIVGTGELAESVAKQILDSPWSGLNLVGFFDDKPLSMANISQTLPLLGGLNDIANYVFQNRIDQVWLAIPWIDQEKLQKALFNLRDCVVDVNMIPDLFSYRLLRQSLSIVIDLPLLNLSATPIQGLNRIAKNLMDWVLALLILMLVSPILLAIAAGVKLSSPGPILFRQIRHGLDGHEIEIWKFRTMKVHQEAGNRVTQATKNDPRVTPFGGFLRRTSLDELPQFINVLQGRMSIVGPRPHAITHNRHYRKQINKYMLRHKVKPGITGWAQINGCRGETDTLEKMQRRIEYDLQYIENWSLWLDIRIILLTCCKFFIDRNAY